MNILLVSPKTPATFWSFAHALPFVSRRSTNPPLGLLTVAGMLPTDWDLRLVDLDVEELDDATILRADHVFLGGMIVHRESAREVARRCRRLGRTVIAGGALFLSNREDFPEIDHFVVGEAEELIEELVEDLERGSPKPLYEAEGFPSLERTPVPRWDLLCMDRYATMPIQFSRGCPFDCEFCNVIEMNGRKPRTKQPARFLAELDALFGAGWRGDVFVVDDNFIGKRQRARELLRALIDWQEQRGHPLRFLTEASVDLASDPALLALMVRAGFDKVFVGIETPDPICLRESHKLQNTGTDLGEAIRTLQEAGLEVMGGFIVGFDHDRPDVFERQFAFIQQSGVVTAMVGILTALPRTRLYRRLAREGRLLAESRGNNTEALCNFVPRLGRDTVERGYRELMRRLYDPQAYYRRARVFLRRHRARPRPLHGSRDLRAFLRAMWVLGVREKGRRAYWAFLLSVLLRRPRQLAMAVSVAIHGHHFRKVAASL